MQSKLWRAAFSAGIAVVVLSCTDAIVAPPRTASQLGAKHDVVGLPDIRISEIHYDNSGTDVNEAIEISGPAGTDLTGWQLVLYNGSPSSLSSYNTKALSGTIAASCGARGVMVVNYGVNIIQNGGGDAPNNEPDGVALVNNGVVVEFLSYEGTFTAANGPAAGLTSVDIGVHESGTEPSSPAVQSLQRSGSNVWSGPVANTFGSCNDNDAPAVVIASVNVAPPNATILEGATQSFTATALDGDGNPIPEVAFTWTSGAPSIATVSATGEVTGASVGDALITATAPNGVFGTAMVHVNAPTPPAIVINELMADPHHAAGGASFGEWFEVYNAGATPIDLQGWTIASAGQPDHLIGSSLIVPAGGFALLGRSADATKNGGVTINYSYSTGDASTTISLDDTDYLVLRDAKGAPVDSVRWTNAATMANGTTRALRDAGSDNADVDGANWGYSTVAFGDGDLGTPGAANGTLSDKPPVIINTPVPPHAVLDGPYASNEGSVVAMSGAASADPNGTIVSYAWTFGDGGTGTGASVSHTYVQDGSYTVRLIVTDNDGLADTTSTTATVSNVSPVLSDLPTDTLFLGEDYKATGSFTDPGADHWIVKVDYGDGSRVSRLRHMNQTFSLSHEYNRPGTRTITVSVTDDHGTTTRSVDVVVLTWRQGIEAMVIAAIDRLVAKGKISPAEAAALKSNLSYAIAFLERNRRMSTDVLRNHCDRLEQLERRGRISHADVEWTRGRIMRLIRSMSR